MTAVVITKQRPVNQKGDTPATICASEPKAMQMIALTAQPAPGPVIVAI